MTFTKEQIHDAIITRHKEVFGYIGKDDEGEEVYRDGYFIAGFVKDALDNFEQRQEAGQLETLVMPQQLPTKAKIKLIGGKETICPVKRIDFRDGEIFRVNIEYALDEKHNQYLTYYFDGRMVGEEGDIDVSEIFLGFVA